MKKILFIFAALFAGFVNAQDQKLFSIDDDAVTAAEFKAVYLKNRDIGKNIDPKTPAEYLELFINFKLKVKEAQDLGYDTLNAFINEFNNYRKQLAKPYLEDRSVDSVLVHEAYSRLQLEVRASHIMIDLPGSALPSDTLNAYNQIIGLRNQVVKNGIPFDVVAKKFSSDGGSSEKGGDLGYFTVFDMVYPFETAAYNTKVGEISMPVRSQFGYHIIKTVDIRKSSGSVEVKHIFLISNDKTEKEKAESAAKRIEEIYAKLQAGEDFDQLARQFSDDKNTSEMGGLLKPFGINDMMQEFEDESFALKNPGDYSKPFKTEIGWHIVKLVKKNPVPSFDEVKGTIEQKISRDSRSAKSKQVFIAKLKKEYNFHEYPKRLTEVLKVVDDSYLTGMWDIEKASKLKKPMFVLNGQEFTQQDFAMFLTETQKRGNKSESVKQEVYAQYNNFVNKSIMSYEDARLEEKYPEFKMLVQEYRDGILLFDLTQERVWNKASQDSTGLYEFWEGHQANYVWPDRVDANLYSCESEKVAKKVVKMINKGSTTEQIEAMFNEASELVVVPDSGKYSKGDNKSVDQAAWKTGTVTIVAADDRYIVVKINEFLPSRNKELAEARGLIISDYQKQLEEDWLTELKQRYTITIDQDVFRSLEAELN